MSFEDYWDALTSGVTESLSLFNGSGRSLSSSVASTSPNLLGRLDDLPFPTLPNTEENFSAGGWSAKDVSTMLEPLSSVLPQYLLKTQSSTSTTPLP